MRSNLLPAGAIFDMDGVLIDSNPFHLQKWIDLLGEHRIDYSPEELPKQILGHRNDTALRHFFGSRISENDIAQLSEELEERFRRVFKPHARPLPGLTSLVIECHGAGIPMAVASSAMGKNVEFVVDALNFRQYFRSMINGDEVSHPKPHPEIYLKTADKLGVKPRDCVAFEDSFVGVDAAKRAGMMCVAIASTFSREELEHHGQADMVVESFEDLSLDGLRRLFQD